MISIVVTIKLIIEGFKFLVMSYNLGNFFNWFVDFSTTLVA